MELNLDMKKELTDEEKEARKAKYAAEILPKGTHDARCIGCCDLGTVDTFYEGAPTGRYRFMRLMFEFPDFQITYEKDGKEITAPKVAHEDFKIIGGEKANLTKLLISWMETTVIPDTKVFNGIPASVTIIHKPGKEGSIWANIEKGGIKQMNEKYIEALAPQYNPDMSFSINDNGFDSEAYKLQWPGTKKKIEQSFEYKEYINGPKKEKKPINLPFD